MGTLNFSVKLFVSPFVSPELNRSNDPNKLKNENALVAEIKQINPKSTQFIPNSQDEHNKYPPFCHMFSLLFCILKW